MPKRKDIKSVLIIGSGPIIIGQACEFDYSGTQALKALAEEGIRAIIVNSNPATIMTDPEFAWKTYIEPIKAEVVERIIKKERPDALIATLGGQTALNIAVELAEAGVLERYGVELLGVSVEAIKKAEDRSLFKKAMEKIGLATPPSGEASTFQEALEIAEQTGFPLVIRPFFTLGGTGGSIAHNREELKELFERAAALSPVGKALVEKSLLGWKEFELEVMRDRADNVVIICSIENFDPMGVHTGDSITVAPAQTLSDREYQRMRDAAIAIIREIGVDTGGSNIQFAVNPRSGEMYVIEMNPRVSRSSALASKATGFPIAKIATKLALGYTLDELPNDITKKTPASFEPALDYVVVKIPRFAFEKFPGARAELTTQMKSVGEVMAIGRTFPEALGKAFEALETSYSGLQPLVNPSSFPAMAQIKEMLRNLLKRPSAERLLQIADALRFGLDVEEIAALTGISPFFIHGIKRIVEIEERIRGQGIGKLSPELLREAKRHGLSDRWIARLCGVEEELIRSMRKAYGIEPVYKTVDTCAAEFEAVTPYYYSTYEQENEVNRTEKRKVVVLGAGPNRIGQGIEFDYCCVHGVFALQEEGIEAIMVNSNPETVSTDYDTADRLYFEPVTAEHVEAVCRAEGASEVIAQFGGQTPLKIAKDLEARGLTILGTSSSSIDAAEDREKFRELVERLGLRQPRSRIVYKVQQALEAAEALGFPLLVRASYVLGGRAMEIVHNEAELEQTVRESLKEAGGKPVLIDEFLIDAAEVDVDLVCDGEEVLIGGVLEHIHEAGIHSGDSAMVLPAFFLPEGQERAIRDAAAKIALELGIRGLLNLQFAVRGEDIFVIEANPRASRTIPFVSKATGLPLAKIATKVMLGKKLKQMRLDETRPSLYFIKEAVFSFSKFPEADPLLGPEMRSTGEVMGIGRSFGEAFWKAEEAAGFPLPEGGQVFISVKDSDKPRIMPIAAQLAEMGFEIVATEGTARYLQRHGIEAERIGKIKERSEELLKRIAEGKIRMVINTPLGRQDAADSRSIRYMSFLRGIPCYTSVQAAKAALYGIKAKKRKRDEIFCLQNIQQEFKEAAASY